MSTPISSIGVGSGLPLNELLEDLRRAENAPLAALQTRADKESARFSAYGTLKSALDAVSSAAQALGKGETFHAVKANVTGDTFTATVNAGAGAISGNHSITVDQLASAQVMASGRATLEDSTKPVAADATGTVNLDFTVGTGAAATTHSLSVNANASLQDIAKAITDDADLDFSATLMNDGKGFRLIISSNETGAANTITGIGVALAEGGTGDISSLENILAYDADNADPGRATIEDSTKPVAAGATGTVNLSFTVGTGDDATTHSLSVNANASLQDIAKAITDDADLDFSATLMNDGKGFRLIISSNETGATNTITGIGVALAEGGTGDISSLENILAYAVGSAGMTTTVPGQNAKATINGIEVTSQGNVLEDAIQGVTITLNKEAAAGAQPDSLQLSRNDAVATTAVNNFVSAYNALQSTIKSLTSYDVDAQEGAALSGDSLARRAQSQMRDALNGLAANGVTLSSIGITTDHTTGNLVVDDKKLNAALTENRAGVEQLFAGEAGLSKRVTSAAEVFTKSDGLIKTSQDGIERTLKLLENQYDTTQDRINQKMETYRRQFVQLDSFMAQMNGVSSYLTTQLSMLNNLSNSNKQ